MLYFFYGDNVLDLDVALHEALAKAAQTAHTDSRDVVVVRPDDENPARVFEALASEGLFSKTTLCVAKNVAAFSKEFRATLLEFLKTRALEKNASAHLFVTHEVLPGVKKQSDELFAFLCKKAEIKVFTKPHGVELARWVEYRAVRRGLKVSRQLAGQLAADCQELPERIASELEKIALYLHATPADPAEVSALHLQLLGAYRASQDAFAVLDAMGKRDARGAIGIFLRLCAQGEDLIKFLGLLVFGVRAMLSVKDAQSRPITPSIIPKLTGLAEWQVRNYSRLIASVPLEDIKKLYERLLVIDFKIKTGEGNPRLLIERFLLRI